MGLIRKSLSVSTLGLIDFRSDKERVARSARLTKRATKQQNKLIKEQNKILRNQQIVIGQPVMTDEQAKAYYAWYYSLTPEQQDAYRKQRGL